ncbi:hypothetical protein [Vibrio sp. CAU 1672]|uniref:hypothetical protein n=1 Tax=Vibrio sp. CAU 1672 TaxID=3032594 RepID=UPI0023DC2ECF|nr:hypothetical protein [Vibrio sp. CAU 1672]MDF2153837.1 hypothetical protein [Vibrio sp. CAU 1672]
MDVSRFIGRPGSEVPDWGEPASIPEFCVDDKQLAPAMVLTDYLQASAGGASRGHVAVLRDVNGNPIYYQQLVNVAEYNYFIENDLQTVTGQQAFVQNKCSGKSAVPGPGTCIQLPQGKLAEQGPLGQNTGATEIKASWRILTQPELARHARSFITSTAYIVEPAEPDSEALPKCSSQVVGLIGLHIIHKDPLKNQFIWSSFEHQNNAPSKGEGSSINDDKPWYSLYRKGCEPDKCGLPNTSPTSITGMTPTQVVRLNPIPDSIDALNRSVQAVFGADSVMRNYELVDVLWTNSARANQESDFRSTNGGRLANTSMETYVQDDNCVSCHLHAKIAKTTDAKALDYHSDFSFVFEQASKAEPQN